MFNVCMLLLISMVTYGARPFDLKDFKSVAS